MHQNRTRARRPPAHVRAGCERAGRAPRTTLLVHARRRRYRGVRGKADAAGAPQPARKRAQRVSAGRHRRWCARRPMRARKIREAGLVSRYAAASCNCIAAGSSLRPVRMGAV